MGHCYVHFAFVFTLSDGRDLRYNFRLETPNYNTIKYRKKVWNIPLILCGMVLITVLKSALR